MQSLPVSLSLVTSGRPEIKCIPNKGKMYLKMKLISISIVC